MGEGLIAGGAKLYQIDTAAYGVVLCIQAIPGNAMNPFFLITFHQSLYSFSLEIVYIDVCFATGGQIVADSGIGIEGIGIG